MWFFCLTTAYGVAPVLYAVGTPTEHLERVSAATGQPPDAYRAMTLPELAAGKAPALVAGVGEVQTCSGSPTGLGDVSSQLDTMRKAVGYLDQERAGRAFAAAEQAIRCLREPLDPTMAARLYFVRGFSLHTAGAKEEEVVAAFASAHRFVADLHWDQDYAPAAEPLFETARARVATGPHGTLDLVPDVGPVYVDGRSATPPLSLAGGWTVVQLGLPTLSTYLVRMESGDALLAVPQALTAEAAGDAPSGRLDAVLPLLAEPGTPLFVSTNGALARTEVGSGTWESLRLPARYAPNRARVAWGNGLIASGGALLVGGSVMFAAGRLSEGQLEATRDESEDVEDSVEAAKRVQGAQSLAAAGIGVAAAGAVAGGVGVVVRFGGRQ